MTLPLTRLPEAEARFTVADCAVLADLAVGEDPRVLVDGVLAQPPTMSSEADISSKVFMKALR